jgi:hypothetical protein
LICCALAGVAVVASAFLGSPWFGVFFGVGLGLGLVNALLVRRSVESITAEAHPLKRKMALNSATRLLVITVIGLVIAFIFRPTGLGVLFGMALFQVLLVLTTTLPVWKKIRSGDSTADEASKD